MDELNELKAIVFEQIDRIEKLEQRVDFLNEQIVYIQRRLNNPAEYGP